MGSRSLLFLASYSCSSCHGWNLSYKADHISTFVVPTSNILMSFFLDDHCVGAIDIRQGLQAQDIRPYGPIHRIVQAHQKLMNLLVISFFLERSIHVALGTSTLTRRYGLIVHKLILQSSIVGHHSRSLLLARRKIRLQLVNSRSVAN